MAISKDQKKAQVATLIDKMGKSESVIFAHYIGMNVAENAEFRGKLREGEAEMKVAKKTLIKIAAKEAGLPEIEDGAMEGPVSLIFSYSDPLSGAQVAFTFGKDHEQVQIVGGIFDGKVLTKEEAVALAKMPSRDVLLATFVGMLQSPLRSFSGMCSSPLSGFARALSEMAEKGGFEGSGSGSGTPGADDQTTETSDNESQDSEETDTGSSDASPESAEPTDSTEPSDSPDPDPDPDPKSES